MISMICHNETAEVLASLPMAARSTDLRERIVHAAADLLSSGGRDAVSTRAVSAAAGVQAPAIYRQFGDMQGLIQAAAREVLTRHVRQKKARPPSADPVEELRRGWDGHVAFGLANPAAYALMYGEAAATEAEPGEDDGYAILQALIARIAEAGRLRVGVPHATRLVHAAARGVTLSLLTSPPTERDPRLSDAMRDVVLDAIIGAPVSKSSGRGDRVAPRAVALRAVLSESGDVLTPSEQQLLGEWLERLAGHARSTNRSRKKLR
jgi:AcrR family transcriptional regulator